MSNLETNTTKLQALLETARNLPKAGSGGGTVSWGDVTKKPFGHEYSTAVTLIDNQTITFDEEQGGYAIPNVNFDGNHAYKIMIDGVEKWEGNPTYVALFMGYSIGNLGLMGLGNDTGEDFFAMSATMIEQTMLFLNEPKNEISITVIQYDYKPLPQSPKTVFYCYSDIVSSDIAYLYREVTGETKVSYDEFMEGFNNHNIVVSFFGMSYYNPISYSNSNDHGELTIMFATRPITLYTAEYTGEE